MLTYECGLTAGQFPKFEDEDVYRMAEDTFRFMLPTAETALINLYRGEILNEADLPEVSVRLHSLLSPGGGHLSRQRARHDPRPSV